MHKNVESIVRTGDGEVKVFFNAKELSEWLRLDMHNEQCKDVLEAVADMIDVCALDAVTQSVDVTAED